MNLHIFNTETRKKELFTPIHPGKVGMYVCGVTVYDLCHIGHASVMVVFDTVVRHLRALGYEVTYVRNITDIDDKIIQEASKNKEDIKGLSQRYTEAYYEDMKALNNLDPSISPLATEHIIEMIIRDVNEKLRRG